MNGNIIKSKDFTKKGLSRPIILNGKYSGRQLKIVKTAFDYLQDCPQENRYRHISIISFKGEVIEVGVNNEKANLTNKPFGYLSIHSEYSVIKKFLRTHYAGQLSKHEFWNLRLNRYNQLAISKPCNRCQSLLQVFAPKKIWYSDWDGFFQLM